MAVEVNQPLPAVRRVIARLLLCLGVLAPTASWGAELSVTVSIPPVHSLAAQVMAGLGSPRLLISGGASPHGFSLTPSQAQMLASSDVVIWIGGGLEASLKKPIATLSQKARLLTLSKQESLHRLKTRSLETLHHEIGHGHGHDHGHGHGHGPGQGEDPHYWLDPENAKVMLDAIAQTLAAADPDRQAAYRANSEDAKKRLDTLIDAFNVRLAPLAGKPFIVFHDAYQYLEHRFGLQAKGVLAIDPERPPGARHINEMRELIVALGAVCLFTEPQFPSRLMGPLTHGTAARVGVLDPLGGAFKSGPNLYAEMLAANLTSFQTCLSGLN